MDLEQNERMEEWFLIIGEWFRTTSKLWFYALVGTFVIAFPLYMLLTLLFEQAWVSSISPIKINYTEVTKLPIEIVDKKIFDLGDNTYSGYVKLKNRNSEWGVPSQKYTYEFKNSSGNYVVGASGTIFILPFSDKYVVLPRFSSETKPTQLNFTLNETEFVRPPTLPTQNLEIQRKSVDLQVNQTMVNAVIVNRMPFKISRVDMPVLLFNRSNEIIGANYTNINDLNSNESRSFQYVWFNRINNVDRIEIIAELNPYNRDIFVAEPGKNPFDDRE